jgi:signal transduction histidine kinase
VLIVGLIAVAGCAAAAAAFALSAGRDEPAPVVDAAIVAWITLSYVFCGLVAWSRRPQSKFGPLLIVAGFGPLLSRLSEVEADLPGTVGEICRLLPLVLFVHVFLAYPSGALERPSERALVIFGYTVVGASAIALLFGLSDRELLEIANWPDAARATQALGRLAIVVFACGAFALLLQRVRRAQSRRSLLLFLFASAFALLAIGLFTKVAGWPVSVPIKWVAFSLIGIAPVLFLAGFLRARLARSAIADLFVELRAEPAPADLRDALARALHDPGLDLVYWLPEFQSYANLDGKEVDLVALSADRTVTYIDAEGVRVAAFVHDSGLTEEPELLEAATAAAAISLENGRLHAELRARLDELRASRARIVQAGQRERQRLERDLHDGAQQRLVALSLDLRLLEDRLSEDPAARASIDHAREEIATSLDELRDVARGIHPAVVSGHGLGVALEELAARASVPVDLRVEFVGRLSDPLEVAAYYVVSESLTNVAKHADAESAGVSVTREHGQLVLEIVDDGQGGADPERGSGLRGLADRVEALNGRLLVWTPRGGGTRVRAEIPCA